MTRIAIARKAKGMSQKELACELKVSCPTVSDWENGKKNPSISNLQRLAKVLDVSVDYLLGRNASIEKELTVISDDELDKELAQLLNALPPEKRQQIVDFARFLNHSDNT